MQPITKIEKLLIWIRKKGIVSSAEIHKYGLQNYFITARRRVQELVETQRLRKLDREEVILKKLDKKGIIAFYEFNHWFRKSNNRSVKKESYRSEY